MTHTSSPPPAASPDPATENVRTGRNETLEERMDRNWNELLQELRVTQTGVQILTGFLLMLPFQQRFADLSPTQRVVYLVLVLLATATTALIVAPVSLHRVLFRRHLKAELVATASRMARDGLVILALLIGGVTLFVFDVVVGRAGALLAGAAVFAMLLTYWLVVPLRMARRTATSH